MTRLNDSQANPNLNEQTRQLEAGRRVVLTSQGRNLAAMDIRDDEMDSLSETWNALPRFHWNAAARVSLGTEVLATFQSAEASGSSETENPFLATRLQGAGRVLYSASDETWRWRYKVADKIPRDSGIRWRAWLCERLTLPKANLSVWMRVG